MLLLPLFLCLRRRLPPLPREEAKIQSELIHILHIYPLPRLLVDRLIVLEVNGPSLFQRLLLQFVLFPLLIQNSLRVTPSDAIFRLKL